MKYIFVLIMLIVGVGFRPKTAYAAPTIVRCEPSTLVLSTSYSFTFDLYVEDAVDLYGLDVAVSFDESVAIIEDVDSVREGVQIEPLATFISPTFVYQQNDNVAGTLRFAAAQATPHPPRTGEGSFARITFQPLSSGNLSFDFIGQQVSDRNGGEQPSTSQDCDIQINFIPLAVDLAKNDVQQHSKAGAVSAFMLLAMTLIVVRHRMINRRLWD